MNVTVSPGCAKLGLPVLLIAGSAKDRFGPPGVLVAWDWLVAVLVGSVPVTVAVLVGPVAVAVLVGSVPVTVALLVGVLVGGVPVTVALLVLVAVTEPFSVLVVLDVGVMLTVGVTLGVTVVEGVAVTLLVALGELVPLGLLVTVGLLVPVELLVTVGDRVVVGVAVLVGVCVLFVFWDRQPPGGAVMKGDATTVLPPFRVIRSPVPEGLLMKDGPVGCPHQLLGALILLGTPVLSPVLVSAYKPAGTAFGSVLPLGPVELLKQLPVTVVNDELLYRPIWLLSMMLPVIATFVALSIWMPFASKLSPAVPA